MIDGGNSDTVVLFNTSRGAWFSCICADGRSSENYFNDLFLDCMKCTAISMKGGLFSLFYYKYSIHTANVFPNDIALSCSYCSNVFIETQYFYNLWCHEYLWNFNQYEVSSSIDEISWCESVLYHQYLRTFLKYQ